MKTRVSVAVAVLLVAVAALASDVSLIDAHLKTVTTARQIRDGKGPLTVDFQIVVTNRSAVPITLKGVELRADDAAGFFVRDGKKNTDTVIAPGVTETIELAGRHLVPRHSARTEPVQVLVRLTFKGPDGKFVKPFAEIIP